MKKYLLTMMGLSLLLLGAAGVRAITSHRIRLYAVQSTSMLPAIAHGDVVMTAAIPFNQLKVGTIVSYRSRIQPGVIITHRIVGITAAHKLLITRGDKLAVLDPPVSEQAVIGKVVHRIPKLGYLVGFMRTIPGLVVGCYVPALYIFIREIQGYGRTTVNS